MKMPAVFLDRYGVLCPEKSYVTCLEDFEIFPYTRTWATLDFEIDMERSCMVGDRISDIRCGQNVHKKTICVSSRYEPNRRAETEAGCVVEEI